MLLHEIGSEPIYESEARFLSLSDRRQFMFWRICSLLCGLPQQGIGALGWCVGGHGWLDSFRVEDLAGKMQDLVAGKPKPMAREQPVMTQGV